MLTDDQRAAFQSVLHDGRRVEAQRLASALVGGVSAEAVLRYALGIDDERRAHVASERAAAVAEERARCVGGIMTLVEKWRDDEKDIPEEAALQCATELELALVATLEARHVDA